MFCNADVWSSMFGLLYLQKKALVPGIFNGSHKKNQLGPSTSNTDMFLQE